MGLMDYFSTTKTNDPRTAEHIQRAQMFDLMFEYYRGKHRQPLKTKKGAVNHNLAENWVGSIVDDGINFLLGSGIEFEFTDDETQTPGKLALDAVWDSRPWPKFNRGEFLTELAQNGAIGGTAYIRLHLDSDGSVTLRSVPPSYVDIRTEPGDVETVIGYHIIWRNGDVWHRHRIEKTETREFWQTTEEMKQAGAKDWQLVDVYPWEYEFPPMFHCKNLPLANSAYGLPDVATLAANDAVNRISSDINKILFYHAHPQMVVTGQYGEIDAIETGAGTMFKMDQGADLSIIEMQSELIASREFRKDQISVLHETNGSTRIDLESAKQGALSGFALRLLFSKLLATTEKKRTTYGGMFEQVNYAIQRLAGLDPEPVFVSWPDPLPINPKEKAEITAIYANAGSSIYGAAIAAGHTAETADMLAETDSLPELEL